jgi:hypothetical protein
MVKLHTDEEIEKYIQAIKLFNKNIKDLRSFIFFILCQQSENCNHK